MEDYREWGRRAGGLKVIPGERRSCRLPDLLVLSGAARGGRGDAKDYSCQRGTETRRGGRRAAKNNENEQLIKSELVRADMGESGLRMIKVKSNDKKITQ